MHWTPQRAVHGSHDVSAWLSDNRSLLSDNRGLLSDNRGLLSDNSARKLRGDCCRKDTLPRCHEPWYICRVAELPRTVAKRTRCKYVESRRSFESAKRSQLQKGHELWQKCCAQENYKKRGAGAIL